MSLARCSIHVRVTTLLLVVALAGAACTHAPRASQAVETKGKTSGAQLGDVFARIAAARAAGRTAIAIFDIDGTLLDPAARTREIFTLAFDGPDPVVHPPRPDLAAAIRTLPLSDHAYEPESTLAKIGVTDTAFVRALKTRWSQDFFSNRFLSRDEAMPGAVSYCDSLHAHGCTIAYFTGRDAPRMYGGTAQSLLERGFPAGIPGTMLVLKPDRTLPDFEYKKSALDTFAGYGMVIAVFENEPRNINLLHERFPEALAFYLDTRHSSGAPAVDPGIAWLKDYAGFRVP
ncbi:MAG: HAD family hydrolase [Candidatus Eisenbacteria bacterium]